MQDYDTVLKLLLREPAGCLMKQLTGGSVFRWLDVELPRAQQPRVDLLGETQSGGLEHIELQSRNHPQMPMRMLEYRVGIFRHYGVFPRQTVFYVGRERLNMPDRIETEHLSFRYHLVDASELDGHALLESDQVSDNVLAILAHVADRGDAIQSILANITKLNPAERSDRINQLLILSELRALAWNIKEELSKMPVTENILDHPLIGPAYRNGEQAMLRKMLETRFGPLPDRVSARLDQSSIEALEEIGVRFLRAKSLEELLP